MTQILHSDREYLVIRDLSEADIKEKLTELEAMAELIANSSVRSLENNRRRYMTPHHEQRELTHHTAFVANPELYVVVSICGSSDKDVIWSIEMSYGNVPINECNPYFGDHTKHGISDHTMPRLEDLTSMVSKDRALAAIDRWIGLLKNPLPKIDPEDDPPIATACARDFIGSVASLAKKRGLIDVMIPDFGELEEYCSPTVRATFPTARELPEVSFGDFLMKSHYFLSKQAASIYACALPIIIWAYKSYSHSYEDGRGEPFLLNFSSWTSSELPFQPSATLDHALGQLPRMPADAIIIPNYPKYE